MLLPWTRPTKIFWGQHGMVICRKGTLGESFPASLTSYQPAMSNWKDFIAQLTDLSPTLKHQSVDIILPNHLVQFAIMPEHNVVFRQRDLDALSRHHLKKRYGDATSDWQIEIAHQGYRQPYILCATPIQLVQQLESLASEHSWTLNSIQPLFAYLSYLYRRQFKKAELIIIAEPQHVLSAHKLKGIWQNISVCKPTESTSAEQIFSLVKRYQLSEGHHKTSRILAFGPNKLFPEIWPDQAVVTYLEMPHDTVARRATELEYAS